MHIYLNQSCHLGKGLEKWQKIEPELRLRYGDFKVYEIQSPGTLSDQIKSGIKEGERLFIAAGGDGTVNLLANVLLSFATTGHEFVLGAIGLGASNDFHKPFRPEAFIKGIPIRMNWQKAVLNDVIQVRYKKNQEHFSTLHCIINASIGIVSQANALNNSGHPLIDSIRKVSVEASIVAAALMTILTYRNISCTISLDNSRDIKLTNLGVIKNSYFAGGLCYDTNIRPDDGNFGVNLCTNMTKFEAMKTMLRLYKHKFSGYPKTYSCLATRLSLSSEKTFPLEIDGEIVFTKNVEFQLIPRVLRCCQ